MHKIIPNCLIYMLGFSLFFQSALADEKPKKSRDELAKATEVWKPVPPVIYLSQSGIPSDAVVLFDGKDLDAWESVKGGPAKWQVSNGTFTVVPHSGSIVTKDSFCDVQLHIEWKSPAKIPGKSGQGLGNSGVFFQKRYEIQVLDSYENVTYSNGQAASVYKQHIPLVNAMRPTGEWQTYDVIFTAPRFSPDGKVERPAYMTALHNGVLVLNHVKLGGPTVYVGPPKYEAHKCAPIMLQDHRDKVSFRNIWLRKL